MTARTLRLQLISDTHFEFHADSGGSFIDSLDPRSVDVLVVASDLCEGLGLVRDSLERLCDRYAHVVYVAGNHELFGGTPDRFHDDMAATSARLTNLHWLRQAAIEISGVRIAGTTMWFRPDDDAHRAAMPDFAHISELEPWVYEENQRALGFLLSELDRADVIVTHHLPSHRSTPPRYQGSSLSPFFVCDLKRLIERRGPPLWLHGHTHSSADYVIGQTRVVLQLVRHPSGAEPRLRGPARHRRGTAGYGRRRMTTRVAFITDLHADLLALEAALTLIDAMGIGLIVCAGDLVDGGDQPEQVIALLRGREIPCIRGNHDRWAVARSDTGEPEHEGAVRKLLLKPATVAWLAGLPTRWDATLEGVRVAVRHGTPKSDMDGIYPDATECDLDRWLRQAEADVLVVGHTHIPLEKHASGGRMVLNPGALWSGAEALAGGCLGVLELPAKRWTVHRVSADQDGARDDG